MQFSVEQGMSAFPWGARAELPGVSECLVFPYNLTLHFWEATLYGQRITRLCPWARMLSETHPHKNSMFLETLLYLPVSHGPLGGCRLGCNNDWCSVKEIISSSHLCIPHGSLRHARHLPGADKQEFIAASLALSLAL